MTAGLVVTAIFGGIALVVFVAGIWVVSALEPHALDDDEDEPPYLR